MSENGVIGRKIQRLAEGSVPRVVDLFSGCGGLSLGFHRAGFKILAGIDSDPEAAASHSVNFERVDLPRSKRACLDFARDITKLDPAEVVRQLGNHRPGEAVDILIGGPPCQSYARVGRAKLREVADHPEAYRVDPRGNLYLRYLEYVRVLKPLVIVMENVPDVLNYGGHNIAEEMADALERRGYRCRYTLLNAVFHGVPQMRERMFLVAYHERLEADVRFPSPTNHYELPRGYHGARRVALKQLFLEKLLSPGSRYVVPRGATGDLPSAITAQEALDDLPTITRHLKGERRKGRRTFDILQMYRQNAATKYPRTMRHWPDFEGGEGVRDHVIRALPRDYKIFRRMEPGEQYPQAYARAEQLFWSHVAKRRNTRHEVAVDSTEFEELWKRFVPPYDPGKFPNKWRKMEPDEPARTVMAHLGKDSYSHIHYDSRQARTISVREAARLQSFPDGFVFVGAMNAAFRQIGNAVPPLLAWQLATTIMRDAVSPLANKAEAQYWPEAPEPLPSNQAAS